MGEESAEELADRISDDIHALRDRTSGQPARPPTVGGINRPQDVWGVVVPLANAPGRLANVLDHLVGYLRRGAGEFATDDDAEPAVRALDAVEWLDSAARHLEQAVEPLQRAGEALSRLKLTPEAEDALEAALAAIEPTDPDVERLGTPLWKKQRGET
jgi:hypothetical protein